ncbi:MAG: HDOD domain-containing protein [Methylococcales bacterium]|nr:HDOD domain-containing protein [Methylococcales bacterium]
MSNEMPLVSLIEQKLASNDVELPVFDGIAQRIYEEVRNNALDADGICAFLEEDPVLVAEVLRMANSSYFSGVSEIRSLRDAAVRLGIKQVSTIVFSANQKRLYSASKGLFKTRLVELWQHASAVSLGSRWLASYMGYSRFADEAYIAGLLHDVGKLSLLRIIEELVASEGLVVSNETVNSTLQQLYCTHGAKLLEIWQLPDVFQQVVLHQADETYDESNKILSIVRLVDKASVLEGLSDVRDTAGIDLGLLSETRSLGLTELDIAELSIMLEDSSGYRDAA